MGWVPPASIALGAWCPARRDAPLHSSRVGKQQFVLLGTFLSIPHAPGDGLLVPAALTVLLSLQSSGG